MDLIETLCVHITDRCNLVCTHCRSASSPMSSAEIDLPLVKEFLYKIKSLGLKHVSISGGEPGIDHRVGEFTKWLLSEGFYVTITTNGTGHLLRHLELNNIAPGSRLRINVSIDGAKSIHNKIRGDTNFERVIVEANKIKAWLQWLGINTVITSDVNATLHQLVPYINSLDADRWALITPISRGRFKEELDAGKVLQMVVDSKALIQDLGFRGKVVIYNFLGTPHTSMLVDVDGFIRVTGVSDDDDIIIGELKSFSLASFSKLVTQHKYSKGMNCFTWKHWDNNVMPQRNP